jgi:sarcosine oxidase subunit delta
MLRIPCPHCGVRDEPEFVFGGPAHIARPAHTCSDEQWSDYLHSRENPKGVHLERWCHLYGCNRWFNVARDTLTHRILTVYAMGSTPPPIGSTAR